MKTTPRSKTRSKVAMPKAEVWFASNEAESAGILTKLGIWGHHIPVAVLPHPTKSAAQAKVRFDNLGWEEKRERIARACVDPSWDWDDFTDDERNAWLETADAVLLAIGERPERGGGS